MPGFNEILCRTEGMSNKCSYMVSPDCMTPGPTRYNVPLNQAGTFPPENDRLGDCLFRTFWYYTIKMMDEHNHFLEQIERNAF